MISVVVPHVPFEGADAMLNDCLTSINGYDELIMVINDGIGYGKAFNRGFKYANGDYILAVSNDIVLTNGTLQEMCDPIAVTLSENSQFGCFFCMPKWVYKLIGGFDETFGLAYYEDTDYLLRLEDARIPVKRVKVKVNHIGGATVKALGKEQEASQIGHNRYVEKWGSREAIIP